MGGLKIKGYKEISQQIVDARLNPATVFITMQNGHIGKEAVPCVKEGDTVAAGTLIGKADGLVSANVFSSISGKVAGIIKTDILGGRAGAVIKIENDNKNKTKAFKPLAADADKAAVLTRIREAGIVGLGGAGFPAYVKFLTDAKIDTLILNGCECESYLTCDDMLMCTYAQQILHGGKILAGVLGLNKFIVGIESNKKQAINAMKEAAAQIKDVKAVIKVLRTKYPMGAEKMLIKHITGRIVPLGSLPADVGCVVSNVATAYAVWDACVNGKPLYEKLCTISGGAIKRTGNVWLKNGTRIEDVMVFFGGEKFDKAEIGYLNRYADTLAINEEDAWVDYMKAIGEKKSSEEIAKLKATYKTVKKESRKKIKAKAKELNKKGRDILAKIIAGGAMGGEAIESTDIPSNITTGGLLFLTPRETNIVDESPCINCKKCIKVCPMRLKPVDICESYAHGDFEKCKKLTPGGCFVCGCCSYVCPARINLSQKIAQIKKEIR